MRARAETAPASARRRGEDGRPADERGADLRERIFRAALEVCAEKGYHATRIDEIVERAGTSKGGLYHHFGGKRDLFLQLYDSVMQRGVAELDGALAGLPAIDALRSVFQAFESWLDDPVFIRGVTEFYVLGLRDAEIRDRFAASYAGVIELGAALVRRGIAEGDLDPALDPERVVRALFPAADGLLFMQLVLGRMDDAKEVLRDYAELVIRALEPRRGA